MSKGDIYYMPKHGKLWVITKASKRDVTLTCDNVDLPCRRDNLTWMRNQGMIVFIGAI